MAVLSTKDYVNTEIIYSTTLQSEVSDKNRKIVFIIKMKIRQLLAMWKAPDTKLKMNSSKGNHQCIQKPEDGCIYHF